MHSLHYFDYIEKAYNEINGNNRFRVDYLSQEADNKRK